MSEKENNTYDRRTAVHIVNEAVEFGLPVPTVVKLYQSAVKAAAPLISSEERAAYFKERERVFKCLLWAYSKKVPEMDREEVKKIVGAHKEENILRIMDPALRGKNGNA